MILIWYLFTNKNFEGQYSKKLEKWRHRQVICDILLLTKFPWSGKSKVGNLYMQLQINKQNIILERQIEFLPEKIYSPPKHL